MTFDDNSMLDDYWRSDEDKYVYNLFKKAYHLACHVHSGQTRDEGTPYITHIDGIIDILQNEFRDYNIDKWTVASLHDVLEDSDLTYNSLKDMFNEIIANHVDVLTKKEGMTREEYVKGIREYEQNDFIIDIKLADRLHNVRSLKAIINVKPDKVVRYIRETEEVYLPLAKEFNIKFYNKLSTELNEIKTLL